MKVGLIDIDSKIPNLALMKLSAWYKREGYQVEMTSPLFTSRNGRYDRVFASKIFDYTTLPILPAGVQMGGSGVDLQTKLPDYIEHIYPDYNLYSCDYAMGHTSRGCNRSCPFCIVPKKEGKWKKVAYINEFWDGQDKLLLLDSSINTEEEHFIDVCDFLIDKNIEVRFSQGLDIRYFTGIQAGKLSQLRLWKNRIHFAWDAMSAERAVRKGIKKLKGCGLASRSVFFILIGYNTTREEDLYRVETLRGLGIDPFIMPYDKFDSYQYNFARWVNRKAIFKSTRWEDYKRPYKKSAASTRIQSLWGEHD